MKPSDILTDESKWTKHCLARDKDKAGVPPLDKRAVCWCLQGALIKSCQIKDTDEYDTEKYKKELDRIDDYCVSHSEIWITNLNDKKTTTFQDIQKLLAELNL